MKNKNSLNLVTGKDFNIKAYLDTCVNLRPSSLIMDDLKWKYMVRSAIRGKNILLLGPTGCGKTLAAQTVAKAIGREDNFFYFNLGATQDARSALIGNTHFDKKTGTLFKESSFIKAIRTPNAIILLDEISRSHHDGVNILMTVLDDLQRYLRLDEKDDCEVVKVAEGVTFIASADKGYEAFEFAKASEEIYHFAWDDLCDWYLELVKESFAKGGEQADKSRRVLGHVLDQLLRLMHPSMPFITETIWCELTGGESLVIANWPAVSKAYKCVWVFVFDGTQHRRQIFHAAWVAFLFNHLNAAALERNFECCVVFQTKQVVNINTGDGFHAVGLEHVYQSGGHGLGLLQQQEEVGQLHLDQFSAERCGR